MKLSSSSRVITFVVVVVIGINRIGCCPVYNVSMEQILEKNPYLRTINEELGPRGFMSGDGLRNFLAKLLVKTACPSLTSVTEKSDGGRENAHLMDHHHEDSHDHQGALDLRHNHDNHNHKESDTDHHENHADDHDHGSLIDTSQFKDRLNNKKENMVDSRRFTDNGKNGHEQTSSFGTSEKVQEDSHFSREDTSVSNVVMETKNCDAIEDIISRANLGETDSVLLPHDFLQLCPSILNSILRPPCENLNELRMTISHNGIATSHDQGLNRGYDHRGHNHHHRNKKESTNMTRDSWIAAILSLVIIGLTSFSCIMIIPILKRSRYYVLINHFLLALAVGTLAGDALIHLIPHAMTMELSIKLNGHLTHALFGFTIFAGILVFLLMERGHDLFGHKHSHGHSHDTSATVDGDDLIKEIGIISAELNETPAQRFDKIGEKLSQHSKHSSFIFAESTSPSEAPRGCFESCPPNLGPGLEDANGNNGNLDSMVCKPRVVDHNSASVAECERLVTIQINDKHEQMSSKAPHSPIPPPPLVQSNTPKALVRQDSKNFNMVLQEYHVGHHGHSHHGHSHVTGKKDSLRTMILLGDAMHTFMDGMAIGAAFGTSLTGGIATAIAVLCHELPHKVGDFAILFEMGVKRRQAMKMVLLLWILSFLGLAVGVSIGSIQEVSPWIYCFTAGVFLYLALVDLLAELSIHDTESCSAGSQMVLQLAGMLTGAVIMLFIAIYEHDLEHLLEGAF